MKAPGMSSETPEREIRWNEDGLAPAVVQHARTGEVLMLAWMNREALELTRSTSQVHFWSRSRRQLWRKGETSGNTLALAGLAADCDRDALLVRAAPAGPVCHTGARTCFTAPGEGGGPQGFADLETLWSTITERIESGYPDSYTARLAAGGAPAAGRKLIEEAAELTAAALDHQAGRAVAGRVVEEAADVVYHLLVLLAERGATAREVIEELSRRRR